MGYSFPSPHEGDRSEATVGVRVWCTLLFTMRRVLRRNRCDIIKQSDAWKQSGGT